MVHGREGRNTIVFASHMRILLKVFVVYEKCHMNEFLVGSPKLVCLLPVLLEAVPLPKQVQNRHRVGCERSSFEVRAQRISELDLSVSKFVVLSSMLV